ncbi:MAG: preprotein translocase subunit SecE [Kiritimatiellae bacterium]|nr:preprotein translocase subunit SecE [Kiritimatiellia bacterium]
MSDIVKKTSEYLKGVNAEAKRVTWPGKHELWESSLVVIAFIFILAAATGVFDFICHFALSIIG